jgi:hypothetical protein
MLLQLPCSWLSQLVEKHQSNQTLTFTKPKCIHIIDNGDNKSLLNNYDLRFPEAEHTAGLIQA